MREVRVAARHRESGCTCSEAVVKHNATKDYIGHESSCPLHWFFAATPEDHFKADMVAMRDA